MGRRMELMAKGQKGAGERERERERGGGGGGGWGRKEGGGNRRSGDAGRV